MTSDYQTVIKETWKIPTMELFIASLYSINFKFCEYDSIKHRLELGKPENTYQYLIRRSKHEKDPRNDKLDYTLVIGIDLYNRSSQVLIWLNLERYQKGKKQWKKSNNLNFKTAKIITKYPDAMSIQDRIDFRRYEAKNRNKKLIKLHELKFFNKWASQVNEINKNRGVTTRVYK